MEIKKKDKNSVLQYKLAYGRYYETIVIKYHEHCLRLFANEKVAEPCGFVLDKNVNLRW